MRISDWSSDVCSSDLRVYSKWRYVPEVDAFFGITNVDLGFVLYRLDRSAAAPAPAVLHTVAADSPQQPPAPAPAGAPKDRKSVVYGKSVSVRVDLGGRRIINKKTTQSTPILKENHNHHTAQITTH